MEFEFRQLRHFIAVAEELHFGRAAARARIVQPALTQSIHRLEACLGVSLLERSSRKVALTQAGEVFLREAKALTAHAALARNLARRAATDSASRPLRFGFVASAQYWLVAEAVKAFSDACPRVRIELREGTPASIAEGLMDGSIDVGVLYLPYGDLAAHTVSTRVLALTRHLVAVPAAWALAQRAQLRLADLAEQPFVMYPASSDPYLYRAFVAACADAGFAPRIVHETPLLHTLLTLVARGLGVAAPINDLVRFTPAAGVAFIPLADAPPTLRRELVIAWLPQVESPPLAQLVSAVQDAVLRLNPQTTVEAVPTAPRGAIA